MEEQIVYSKAKYIKGSPRKARLVMDMIRGKGVMDAVNILSFTRKAAAKDILKVLKAGLANCSNNAGWNQDELVVVEARIDDAPVLRRLRRVSRGRAHRILKRNKHIIIGLTTQINYGK